MTMLDCDKSTSKEVFLTSPWIPPEWVKAHGLEPRAGLFAPGFGAENAPLGAGVCAFAQNVVRFSRQETSPAVVFSTHCDQLRRGFDSVPREISGRTFLFNIPAATGRPVAERIFNAELGRLGKFLIKVGGHLPPPAGQARWMEVYETSRQRLRDAADVLPGFYHSQAVARFHWDGPLPYTPSPEIQSAATADDKVRLAIVGGPLRMDPPGLLDQVVAAGARVVLDATEWGERSLGWPDPTAGLQSSVAEDEAENEDAVAPVRTGSAEYKCQGSLSEVLSRRFVETCVDVFQRPNFRLYAWLEERLRSRRVQGIVLWHYFGCDLWRAEAQTMRETLGLPLLVLEADESGSGAERQAGRIEAFVEALK